MSLASKLVFTTPSHTFLSSLDWLELKKVGRPWASGSFRPLLGSALLRGPAGPRISGLRLLQYSLRTPRTKLISPSGRTWNTVALPGAARSFHAEGLSHHEPWVAPPPLWDKTLTVLGLDYSNLYSWILPNFFIFSFFLLGIIAASPNCDLHSTPMPSLCSFGFLVLQYLSNSFTVYISTVGVVCPSVARLGLARIAGPPYPWPWI